MAQVDGFTPYRRVTNGSAADVWLERDDGSRFLVNGAVTDEADGIDPDEDFDFDLASEWAAETEDATDD